MMICKIKRDFKDLESLKKDLDKLQIRYSLAPDSQGQILGLLTYKEEDLAYLKDKYGLSFELTNTSYKLTSLAYQPQPTIIDLANGLKIGRGHFNIISGPCSVESKDQIVQTAQELKAMGVQILRGGAYKPRTSPYSFQGMELEGIKMLLAAKEATGLPIVSEIMDPRDLEYFEDIDILQIGTRNSQNYRLLKEVGKTQKPVLLKRAMAGSLEDLLLSAEYILAEGNPNVILCERGIRTFEQATRNTLDLSAVPVLKSMTHLPIVVDPSHGVGKSAYVPDMALAATAAGADALMIESHLNPAQALSDGDQCLDMARLEETLAKVWQIRKIIDQ